MRGTVGLPVELLRNLPDSELEILSWDGATQVLAVRVSKEIRPEVGVVRFIGVTHVNLPARLGISGIETGDVSDLPPDYLRLYRPGDQCLDPGERVFLIHESWGAEYFVLAREVEYKVC
jgi:hypothetical protein